MEQIGKLIGRRKYEALKAFDLENMTDESLQKFNIQFGGLTVGEGLKAIEQYEKKYVHLSKKQSENVKDYFKKIREPQPESTPKELNKEILWKMFSSHYREKEGVSYSKDELSIENIKPLIYYFVGDLENFKKCNHVSKLSTPSLDKGLLIIGGYGNGKTSVMNAFKSSLKKTNIVFMAYTTNELVMMYEAIKDHFDKDEFNKKIRTGIICFDDVLSEREASNFGKVDIMKEILEERYSKNLRTYITCNYSDEFPEDLDEGLNQFGQRYGSRVYDRLFAMFNIIEFKGESFRK